MKNIKIGEIVNKYLNIVSEQCKCDVNECNLKEEVDQDTNVVGKHNDVPDSEFIEKELKRGIEIEMEHTDNPEIAKSIAKDHLSECKVYYTLLDQMENKCKSIK